MGYVEFFQSLRIWCRSVWQMPQYAILILMSRSPTGRREKRKGARWPAFQALWWGIRTADFRPWLVGYVVITAG